MEILEGVETLRDAMLVIPVAEPVRHCAQVKTNPLVMAYVQICLSEGVVQHALESACHHSQVGHDGEPG